MNGQTLEFLAEMICGDDTSRFPVYRSSMYLTRFFDSAGIPRFKHDGSTRKWWTLEALKNCSSDEIRKVILQLANPREYRADKDAVRLALKSLNEILLLEGLRVELSGPHPVIKPIRASFSLDDDEGTTQVLKPLPPPDFRSLNLPTGIDKIMSDRWNEADICIKNGAFLMAVVAMGGLLEGLLLGAIQNRPKIANQSKASPKSADGKVKPFSEWTLSEMIDMAHEVGWIDLDVKRFSHSLREFRNLIHPFLQYAYRTNPDEDTCKISWLVVQAAINDLARHMK